MADTITRKVVAIFAGEAAGAAGGKVAASSIPFIGWVTFTAQVLHGAESMGPILKYMGYMINSAAAVQLYGVYLTSASEMKSGHVDMTQLGTLSSALDTNIDGSTEKQSAATETPLYNYYNDASPTPSTTAMLGSFSPFASAASTEDSNGYTCDDGKPVPSGSLVCKEEQLNRGNETASDISKGVKDGLSLVPGAQNVVDAVSWASSKVGGIISKIIGLFNLPKCGAIPGCGAAKDYILNHAQDLMNYIIDKIVSSPFAGILTGGRIYDMMVAGANVSHNKDCQVTVGCQLVSDADSSQIQRVYIDNEKQGFYKESLFARMFSTDTPYSLISRVAISMPAGKTSAVMGVKSYFTHNPLASMGRLASVILPTHTVGAEDPIQDPFGVPQAAFPKDQIPKNPLEFFNNNCMEGAYGVYDADSRTVDISEWLNTDGNTTIDPDTGQEVNAKVNPCKLILSALQAAGGIYDPSLLPEDSLQSDTGATGLGGEFRLASFNICYGIAADGHSYADCAHGVDYKPRLANSISVIKDHDFGVVGLQEVRGPHTPKGDQFSDLKSLDGFSIFPTTYNSYAAQNPIIWNDDFTLVQGKVIPGYTVTGGKNPAANTQVKLRYKTGQEFYVINHHEPVGNTRRDQIWRRDSAQERAAYVKELAKEGLPIFLTGDMNSSYNAAGAGQTALDGSRANLPYCILTDGTELWDAIDAVANRTGTCPYTDRAGVDHIYMSTSVTAKNREYFGAGVNNNGSDHNTLSVDVAFPGAEDAAGGGAATPGKGFVGNDGFGGGWCTDYVKWILNRHSSKYRGTSSLGDGKDVARSLGGAPYGYTVNHTPAVHAVVSFPGPPYGDVGTRFAGHVAIVGQVNKDGSIVVEESNFTNSMSYGTHSVSAAEAKNLTYAHTEVGWH